MVIMATKQHIIAGEASESSEDEIILLNHEGAATTIRTKEKKSAGVKNHIKQASHAIKKPALKHLNIVSGEASESDEEIVTGKIPMKPFMVENEDKSVELQQVSPEKPKYDSLLHLKLRESNASLLHSLKENVGQVYQSSAKELKTMAQQLSKSQLAIQDVSHHTRLVTNDLFYLEDKIDIVSSCSLLPVISLEKLSSLEKENPLHKADENIQITESDDVAVKNS